MMHKFWPMAMAILLVANASIAAAPVSKPPSPAAVSTEEAGLDLSLRTSAAAMPVITRDGSTYSSAASHIYLMDADTGSVLANKAGEQKMYPSSMTKMMTLYLIFSKLKEQSLTLSSQFTVSEKAWRMQGSKMFVPLGGQIGLEDLIRGIAIQSGNDACVVVAEGIAGSEDAFAKQMNDTAKAIGMTASHFTDASGWPHPEHTMTAKDLAVLASRLIKDFPEYYHYFSEREFVYHGIRQFNRNLLLGNPSLVVDGLKTGHTEAAGYGITLSAKDPASGRRLVLVINGLDSEVTRAQEGEALLKWGFANFKNVTAFRAGEAIIEAPVWMGALRTMPLTLNEPVIVTIPKTGQAGVKATVNYTSPLIAPITKGQQVGTLTITHTDGTTREVAVIAASDTQALSFIGRVGRRLGL